MEVSRRDRELGVVVEDLHKAVGEVSEDCEVGRWLAWADDHVKESDPLRHLREALDVH